MTVKRGEAGRTGAGLPGRPRAVLFDPQGTNGARHLTACAEYATAHGYDVVAVVRRLEDAIYELGHGRADTLIVMTAEQLHPLIQIVTDASSTTSLSPGPGRRRPRLMR